MIRIRKALWMMTLVCVSLLFCLQTRADEAPAADPETWLDLGERVLSMEELTALLDASPSLRRVDMYANVVEKPQIDYLAERYPQIDFGWTIHIPGRFEGHTVRTDQTAFSTLHGNCITHTSEDFSVLQYCRDLQALDLGHNVIEDISFLSGLTKMKILILACNRISDLSPLSGMRDLEYVELFSNPISDLSPLYDLPHLTDVNVAYLELTDPDALFHFPAAQRLWVSRCMKGKYNLKKAQLRALREAYPDTVICSQGEPTEGGWRRHPHYDVMKKCFLTGVYSPFQ